MKLALVSFISYFTLVTLAATFRVTGFSFDFPAWKDFYGEEFLASFTDSDYYDYDYEDEFEDEEDEDEYDYEEDFEDAELQKC